MTPHKCTYFRCENTSDKKSMFRFPWKDESRLQEWITKCGNMSITHLPAERLRSKYLCIDHFDTEYVRNYEDAYIHIRRKTLRKTAVPYDFTNTSGTTWRRLLPVPSDSKVLAPKRVYKNVKKLLAIPEEPLHADEDRHPLNTPKRRKTCHEDNKGLLKHKEARNTAKPCKKTPAKGREERLKDSLTKSHSPMPINDDPLISVSETDLEESEIIDNLDNSQDNSSDINEEVKIEFDPSVCRTCLTESALTPLSANSEGSTLGAMLELIAGVKMEEGLPKNICYICTRDLEIAIAFRHRAQISDKRLRNNMPATATTISYDNHATNSIVTIKHESADTLDSNSTNADPLEIAEIIKAQLGTQIAEESLRENTATRALLVETNHNDNLPSCIIKRELDSNPNDPLFENEEIIVYKVRPQIADETLGENTTTIATSDVANDNIASNPPSSIKCESPDILDTTSNDAYLLFEDSEIVNGKRFSTQIADETLDDNTATIEMSVDDNDSIASNLSNDSIIHESPDVLDSNSNNADPLEVAEIINAKRLRTQVVNETLGENTTTTALSIDTNDVDNLPSCSIKCESPDLLDSNSNDAYSLFEDVEMVNGKRISTQIADETLSENMAITALSVGNNDNPASNLSSSITFESPDSNSNEADPLFKDVEIINNTIINGKRLCSQIADETLSENTITASAVGENDNLASNFPNNIKLESLHDSNSNDENPLLEDVEIISDNSHISTVLSESEMCKENKRQSPFNISPGTKATAHIKAPSLQCNKMHTHSVPQVHKLKHVDKIQIPVEMLQKVKLKRKPKILNSSLL